MKAEARAWLIRVLFGLAALAAVFQVAVSVQAQSWSVAARSFALLCGAFVLIRHPHILLRSFPLPVAEFTSLSPASKAVGVLGGILFAASFWLSGAP
jgi:hypothetical protein